MRSFGVATLVTLAALLMYSEPAVAQATQETEKCGPPSWGRPNCAICKEGGKVYTLSKFVEGAIAIVLESIKAPTDPKTVVDAISAAIGATHIGQKRWTESGQASPEMTDTYCWKPVKAEEIKPLKSRGYLLGSFYYGKCQVEADTCYHVSMECKKERDAKVWVCVPKLQEFKTRGGKCVDADSPTATLCDCQPSTYWKCGAGATKPGRARPARRRR